MVIRKTNTADDDRQECRKLTILHAEHGPAVRRLICGVTWVDRNTAEDLMQETMLRTWRNIATVPDDSESARRWLFTVARRTAIDFLRGRKVRPVEVEMGFGAEAVTEDSATIAVALSMLRDAFRNLNDAQRTVISEMYLHGATAEELAVRLGVPVGTVKSRARNGMRRLRDAVLGNQGS
jgi:RNA polymerase sigma-70 factor, ECF subfamily